MNTRDPKPLKAVGGMEWKVLPFSFVPNTSDSTASPAAATVFGPVNVSWTATGTYRVQIQNAPGAGAAGAPRMIVMPPGVETALKGLFQVDVTNVNMTQGFFDLKTYTFATTTVINFTATTSVQRVSGQIWLQASSYTR